MIHDFRASARHIGLDGQDKAKAYAVALGCKILVFATPHVFVFFFVKGTRFGGHGLNGKRRKDTCRRSKHLKTLTNVSVKTKFQGRAPCKVVAKWLTC